MSDKHYQELLAGQNGCKFTSLERKIPVGYPGVAMYQDDSKRVRLNYTNKGEPVAGILLQPLGTGKGYQISHVYTVEGHRRCGYARSLLFVARQHWNKVIHSDNLTTLGKLWRDGVEGLSKCG